MTADEKGLQGAGIAMSHGGMLGQLTKLPERGRTDAEQLADFADSVDRSGREVLGLEEGLEQGFGLRPEVRGWAGSADAALTA